MKWDFILILSAIIWHVGIQQNIDIDIMNVTDSLQLNWFNASSLDPISEYIKLHAVIRCPNEFSESRVRAKMVLASVVAHNSRVFIVKPEWECVLLECLEWMIHTQIVNRVLERGHTYARAATKCERSAYSLAPSRTHIVFLSTR